MLQDGIELVAGSQVSNMTVESGTTLPASGSDGQQFNLTQQDGVNAPGMYIYDTTAVTWNVVGDITGVTAGSGLSGGGVAGTVTLTLDRTALPYDIGVNAVGTVAASATVLRLTAVRAFVLPAGLTASLAKAGAAATASAVFSVKKNGTEFGTITFAAAGTVGTLAAASPTSFAIGDVLTVVGPASADATLADIGITLAATLAA